MFSRWNVAVVRSLAPVLALCSIVLIHGAAYAGNLELSWTAPTTTVTGQPLTNLAGYRVYYGTGSAGCPGGTYLQVASPSATPSANQTMTFTVSGLNTGTAYYIGVTAVDANGQESACVSSASATVARDALSLTPSGTVAFGNVNVGSSADQTFTVQNDGQSAVSGTVSASAPFSVVAGGQYDLAAGGGRANVTVRFSPATAVATTSNVTFAMNGGGTISRVVTGTGTTSTASLSPNNQAPSLPAPSSPTPSNPTPSSSTPSTPAPSSAVPSGPGDTTPPTVSLTAPANGASVSGSAVILTASASDNVGVVGVQFKVNGMNLGSEVTAPPYRISWYTLSTPNGSHKLTAVARDAAGNTTTSTAVTVTLTNGAATPASTTPAAVNASAPAPIAPAPLAYDNAVSSGFQWGVTSITTPAFVVGSGANRAAMIMVAMSSNNATNISASLGGVPATLIPGTDSGASAVIRTLVFQVVNPPSGAQTATVSWTTAMHADVGVITVTGANQATPTTNGRFAAFNASPTAATSVTIPSDPGDLTASIAFTTNQWSSPPTNQTFVWGPTSSPVQGDRGTGAGTTTHTWTDSFAGIPRSVSGANFRAAGRL